MQREIGAALPERRAKRSGTGVPPVCFCLPVSALPHSRLLLLLQSCLRSPISDLRFLLCASVPLWFRFPVVSSSGVVVLLYVLCLFAFLWSFFQTNPFHISLSCLFTAASVSSLPPAGPQRTQISGFGMSGFQRFRAAIHPNPGKIRVNPSKSDPNKISRSHAASIGNRAFRSSFSVFCPPKSAQVRPLRMNPSMQPPL